MLPLRPVRLLLASLAALTALIFAGPGAQGLPLTAATPTINEAIVATLVGGDLTLTGADLGSLRAAAATVLPPGFEEITVVSGLDQPINFRFAPDGRVFITEKPGVVRVFKDGALLPTPLIDIQDQVNDFWDRGLYSLAFDPDFLSNGYLYLLYTYENDPGDYFGTKTARLTRVTVVGDTASPGTEVVILGSVVGASCEDFPPGADCIPSDAQFHTADDLRFAADGTLFVTTGDAAPALPLQLALRAQDPDSLAGKVLRIHPDGTAAEDNPFWNGAPNANRSKVWARGLRNPFRLALRPGTGTPYLGDVGNVAWEEIDVVHRGANFGWPCYEGPDRQPAFEPNPLCQALYLLGPDAVTPPLYTYATAPYPPGACVIGGSFAVMYPDPYGGGYFFGDCVRSSISYLTVDADNNLIAIQPFATAAGRLVAFNTGPDGEIYYLEFISGELRHIRWVGGNRNPAAVADATKTNGLTPLEVQFSSDESSDPDLDPLTFLWDFGDGTPTSTEANPLHTYTVDGVYTATLTVEDGQGGVSTDTVGITAGDEAPTAIIMEPLDSASYQTGDTITYAGSAVDPEDGPLSDSGLLWTILLHHGSHAHPFISHAGAGGSFVIPDHGDDNWFEIVLTATDSIGLQDSHQIFIYPQEIHLTFETSPSGLYVVYNGQLLETPVTVTTVANSIRSIGAPSPQLQGASDTLFFYWIWSDGGTREHTIPTGKADRALIANFNIDNPVGGIAELPEVAGVPLETDGSSGGNAGLLTGVAGAVAAGTLALGGAAWYGRRRLRR